MRIITFSHNTFNALTISHSWASVGEARIATCHTLKFLQNNIIFNKNYIKIKKKENPPKKVSELFMQFFDN